MSLRTISLMLTFLTSAPVFGDSTKVVERVHEAGRVLDEIMAAPDKGIPKNLLSGAHCIAIVPSMKKGGFILGAQYGKGVVVCRSSGGSGWTGPSTVRVEGGSVGLQAGGAATDLVLLVMNERGSEKLMESEFTLGGDATVAAGPVGRSAEAQTDAYMHAKILAYSRSRGVFAGVALEGATLRSDDRDNEALYGKAVTHKQILKGEVPPPRAATHLISRLNRYSIPDRELSHVRR